MIPKECRRLAEVDFPIAVVSKHAVREKSIRHGHPSTLHRWWARRPSGGRFIQKSHDYSWLDVAINCKAQPTIQESIKAPARFEWREVTKVAHSWMEVDALTRSMEFQEEPPPYGAVWEGEIDHHALARRSNP
ncbi:MAG: DUF1156 domain-containing protein [Coriobacteriia bacterium]|jgi:hypothetical protein|nr:DUF1156 domain-containing protein [Coriobacteriia bacterium]